MSCYEWERGSIRIPRADWAGVKSAVRVAFNEREEKRYLTAQYLVERLRQSETPNFEVEFERLYPSRQFATAYNDRWAIERVIMSDGKLRKSLPTRQDFPAATARTVEFALRGATIRFDDPSTTVHWHVGENNHACDTAHEDPIAIALFGALGKVKWGRNSGGIIVGNNEYNRDADYEGGGGNLVNFRFGPLNCPNHFLPKNHQIIHLTKDFLQNPDNI